MTKRHFPELEPAAIEVTRNALHAYSRLLGDWLKATRARRKHWWHASLRPSLNGLTTGVMYGDTDFEIELNLRESELQLATADGARYSTALTGQSSADLDAMLRGFFKSAGMSPDRIGRAGAKVSERKDETDRLAFAGYSPDAARSLAEVLSGVSAAMNDFRAGIPEECSPIQLWPHHFDLSMIWLPGEKIPDQDPANEEYSDKQMNFGFTFGDDGISEPYFYVTAYPLPDALPNTPLPPEAEWKSDGFSGAVLLYKDLVRSNDATSLLHELWSTLLGAGRAHYNVPG